LSEDVGGRKYSYFFPIFEIFEKTVPRPYFSVIVLNLEAAIRVFNAPNFVGGGCFFDVLSSALDYFGCAPGFARSSRSLAPPRLGPSVFIARKRPIRSLGHFGEK
jgi:hypothetical protein